MKNFEIDLLVLDDLIKKKELEEKNERPFLQLEIEDYYPLEKKEVKNKEEPRRVIIIDI